MPRPKMTQIEELLDVSGRVTDVLATDIQLFQLRLSGTSKAEKSNTSAKGCWESLINDIY
jgi:hypothetical protein